MTNQQHPITPPPELVQQWAHMLEQHTDAEVFTRAARWGADTELEACVELLACRYGEESHVMNLLRAVRRPKPPSLKEQALEALKVIEREYVLGVTTNTIRRALELLPS